VASRRPDGPSLVAGLSILLLGLVLLLDHAGVLDLHFAAFGPIACAVLGAILLASGLAKRD